MLITTLLALFVAPATVFSSPITIKTTYQAYPTDAAGKIDWDAVDWKEVNKYRILDLTLLQSALPPGSHLCVDNMDGRAASGVRVQMWECHGGPEQVWEFDWVTLSGDVFQKNKAKQFRIKRRDADYCLHFDVPGNNTSHLENLGWAYFWEKGGRQVDLDLTKDYMMELKMEKCEKSVRWHWRDHSLCAFEGRGVDPEVRKDRAFGWCIGHSRKDEMNMRNKDLLVVYSDPAYRMKFISPLAGKYAAPV